jgi:hypothetical protein
VALYEGRRKQDQGELERLGRGDQAGGIDTATKTLTGRQQQPDQPQ